MQQLVYTLQDFKTESILHLHIDAFELLAARLQSYNIHIKKCWSMILLDCFQQLFTTVFLIWFTLLFQKFLIHTSIIYILQNEVV